MSVQIYPEKVNWRGNNFSLCKGGCYIAPQFYFGLGTQAYLITYGILVNIFILSKGEYSTLFICIELFLLSLSVIFCNFCIFKNPGALPMYTPLPDELTNVNTVSSI